MDELNLTDMTSLHPARPDREAELATLIVRLEQGWIWLRGHLGHPQADAFYDRWILALREYERAYRTSVDRRAA